MRNPKGEPTRNNDGAGDVLNRIRTGRATCVVGLIVAVALPSWLPAAGEAAPGVSRASTTIAAGVYHTLALKTDGSLWSFGSNLYGELGTTTNAGVTHIIGFGVPNSTPTQVMTGVKEIAAGGYFSLAFNGFYAAASSYTPLVPARLLESRLGAITVDGLSQGTGFRAAGSVTELQVSGRGGVPADASAAVLNVTVTGAQGDGFVTVWPCGTDKPNASSLNFAAGQTIANAVITKVGSGGKVCLSTSTATHLLADINGYEVAS
jgi:Regulator of chromosome condensation (RCC1) repeat